MLDHIRNVDVVPREANVVQELLQEFPCSANERTPELIFLLARPFPHKEDLGIRIPFSGNAACSGLVQGTELTPLNLCGDLLECVLFFLSRHE
jgi:hypothetical protein